MGAGLVVSYHVICDYLRHHDEANSRPRFMDHMIATTTIGTFIGAMKLGSPFHVACASFFSFALIGPTSWWLKLNFRINPVRSPNIFYTNDCTPEEVERFRQ